MPRRTAKSSEPLGGVGGLRLRVLAAFALVVALLAPSTIALPGPLNVPHVTLDAPPEAGPDVPGALLVASILAVDDATWECSSGPRAGSVAVPTGWTRVIAEYTQRPDGDPWDRLFIVTVAGVEVLRGTTPRTDMTVTREITRYATLLPPGATVGVAVDTSSWDCGDIAGQDYRVHADLVLHFYADPVQPDPAASRVVNWGAHATCGKGAVARTLDFGAAPGRAVLEFYASNHASEEADFLNRYFSVRADGVEIANISAFPYVYAILGFYGGNDDLHPVMWWSAHRALDVAGVHLGPGEIPPYRAELSESEVALLQGAKSVEIYSNVNACVWFTSAAFLLYG